MLCILPLPTDWRIEQVLRDEVVAEDSGASPDETFLKHDLQSKKDYEIAIWLKSQHRRRKPLEYLCHESRDMIVCVNALFIASVCQCLSLYKADCIIGRRKNRVFRSRTWNEKLRKSSLSAYWLAFIVYSELLERSFSSITSHSGNEPRKRFAIERKNHLRRKSCSSVSPHTSLSTKIAQLSPRRPSCACLNGFSQRVDMFIVCPDVRYLSAQRIEQQAPTEQVVYFSHNSCLSINATPELVLKHEQLFHRPSSAPQSRLCRHTRVNSPLAVNYCTAVYKSMYRLNDRRPLWSHHTLLSASPLSLCPLSSWSFSLSC